MLARLIFATGGFVLFLGGLACLANPADDRAGDGYVLLAQRNLILPIRGLAAGDIQDTFAQARDGGNLHEATDILKPRGT
ncbi:MAG: hypothetical protein ABI833_18905, partial [Acidobacteriota bacterium]